MFLITSYIVTFIGLGIYWMATSKEKLTYVLTGFWSFKNVTVRKVAIVTLLFPISSPVLLFVLILKFLYWLLEPVRYLFRVAIFGEE
jgi:hypothetical protein